MAETALNIVAGGREDKKTGAGRPRSDESRHAILEATRKLLMRAPLAALSIEAIAKKAGVGKTTIYRWWPSKGAVAMEAFLEQPGVRHIVPAAATASDAMTYQIESLIRQLRGQNGRMIAGIVAESQSDPAVLELLYEKFLKERVEILYRLLDEGKRNGEFRADLDNDIAVDMIFGPLFLRVLSGEHGIDSRFAETAPRQIIRALAA